MSLQVCLRQSRENSNFLGEDEMAVQLYMAAPILQMEKRGRMGM